MNQDDIETYPDTYQGMQEHIIALEARLHAAEEERDSIAAERDLAVAALLDLEAERDRLREEKK